MQMGEKAGPEAGGDTAWMYEEQQRAVWSWEAIVASMAAVPFLQALATHFGNRFATAVDEGTRKAVRRFLRRQVDEHGVSRLVTRASGSSGPRQIHLQTEHGWTVVFDDDLTAEGLAQLVDLCQTAPPVPADELSPGTPAVIYRHRDHWATTGVSAREAAFFVFEWDAEAKRWNSLLPPPDDSDDATTASLT
ncbi:hypothetical protein [Streptomyces sp. NPDC088847]|uniref:hypothetical protein n=1 Tax=Streptomyces sp. NPDC088847 TaxID=3365909 RepID=UPI0037F7409D